VVLIPILKQLFDAIFREKQLSPTMYHGIISQVYKGEKDKSLLSNWRPLTMLNVDYKILTKILTLRLKKFMSKLVHPNQTCSVPGRDIRDGISLIYNVLH